MILIQEKFSIVYHDRVVLHMYVLKAKVIVRLVACEIVLHSLLQEPVRRCEYSN